MRRNRVTFLLLALSFASPHLAACGGETPDESEPKAEDAVELMQDHLVACGLWVKGDLSDNFRSFRAECVVGCLASYEDCDAARSYSCGPSANLENMSSELALCLTGCNHFSCADGIEIYAFNRCDGGADCSDGSDEADCPPRQTFTCANGSEVPLDWRCNAEIDCAQGEDEQNCSEDYFFVCGDGEVLPQSWECDTNPDCRDESDEGPHCARRVCE